MRDLRPLRGDLARKTKHRGVRALPTPRPSLRLPLGRRSAYETSLLVGASAVGVTTAAHADATKGQIFAMHLGDHYDTRQPSALGHT
jgi:hypothetical protein